MIIVDTSVWVDHLRTNDDDLVKLLDGGGVATHPSSWVTWPLEISRNVRAFFRFLESFPLRRW